MLIQVFQSAISTLKCSEGIILLPGYKKDENKFLALSTNKYDKFWAL